MASGVEPVAFRDDLPLTCLGADCHSCGPTSMLHQMQMALASDRATQAARQFNGGQYPKEFRAKIQDAFNLATIKGARASGLGDQIGSLEVGKLADIVLFDATTPAMSCAVDHDPLVAIVRHASVREVSTVIVGGRILKLDGVMHDTDVSITAEQTLISPDSRTPVLHGLMSWLQVKEKLSASRKDIQTRLSEVNMDLARANVRSLMIKDQNIIV